MKTAVSSFIAACLLLGVATCKRRETPAAPTVYVTDRERDLRAQLDNATVGNEYDRRIRFDVVNLCRLEDNLNIRDAVIEAAPAAAFPLEQLPRAIGAGCGILLFPHGSAVGSARAAAELLPRRSDESKESTRREAVYAMQKFLGKIAINWSVFSKDDRLAPTLDAAVNYICPQLHHATLEVLFNIVGSPHDGNVAHIRCSESVD
jgi:hypothetical protein